MINFINIFLTLIAFSCFSPIIIEASSLATKSHKSIPTSNTIKNDESLNVLKKVKLGDGQVIVGFLVEKNLSQVTLELRSGGRIILERKAIISISDGTKIVEENIEEIWHKDPNNTRYFYSPSAFTLKKGESYISQKELILTSVATGLTDNLAFQAGSIIPLLFVSEGRNIITGLKYGRKLHKNFHIAGGLQSILFSEGLTLLPYGVITLGGKSKHLSLAVTSPTFSGSADISNLFWVSINTYMKLSKNIAFITENWLWYKRKSEFSSDNFRFIFGGGLRFMGHRISTDLGFFISKDSDIPIPWIDFAYKF